MTGSDDANAKLAAAIRFSRHVEKTYETGPVARALETDAEGNYVVSLTDIPPLFFNDGPNSAAAILAYISACGDPANLEDYGGNLVREAAIEQDGTFDLVRLDRWMQRYADALTALPGLRLKLEGARAAQMELHEAIADRDRELREYKDSAAGLFLENDAAEAIRLLFQRPDVEADMRFLMQQLNGNQAYVDGLRTGIVDHLLNDVGVLNDRASVFVPYFNAHEKALEVVFEPEAFKKMKDVRDDLSRNLHAQEMMASLDDKPAIPTSRGSWWGRLFG